MYVSYFMCALSILASAVVVWIFPLYGAPFFLLAIVFTVIWHIFLKTYEGETV